MSQEGRNELELGSYSNWVGIRVAEAFAFFVATPVLMWLKPTSTVELGIALGVMALIALVWDSVAYGYADERGVRYRHYLGWHFVAWSEVRGLDWSSAWIVVRRREGSLLRRRIVFPLKRSMKEAWAEARQKALPEPEAVTRVKQYAEAHGLALGEIQRARPKHVMVALALFALLAAMVALAWVALLKP